MSQSDPGRVTLRFITEAGFEAAFIRWWTWGRWSHVDFLMPDGRLLGSRLNGGVQIRPYNYCVPTDFMWASLRMHPTAAAAWEAALVSQIGKPYDWRALAGMAFREDWRSTDRWFCSELLQWASEQAGHPILDAGPDIGRITPRDLALGMPATP